MGNNIPKCWQKIVNKISSKNGNFTPQTLKRNKIRYYFNRNKK